MVITLYVKLPLILWLNLDMPTLLPLGSILIEAPSALFLLPGENQNVIQLMQIDASKGVRESPSDFP